MPRQSNRRNGNFPFGELGAVDYAQCMQGTARESRHHPSVPLRAAEGFRALHVRTGLNALSVNASFDGSVSAAKMVSTCVVGPNALATPPVVGRLLRVEGSDRAAHGP